jgi:biopolymer transport protein ExbD
MRDPAAKKKEEEARQAKERAEQLARTPRVNPGPVEANHVLVSAPEPAIELVSRPAVGMVKVSREGVISAPSLMTFVMGELRSTKQGGAMSASGCCDATDPPEVRAMGGVFMMLRSEAKSGEAAACDEPIVVDGDHKAPWGRVRRIVEVMSKAKLTRLVFATSADPKNLRGVTAKLASPWAPGDALPAGAKTVDVDAAGKDLVITVEGTKYADVAAAVSALQAAGVKEVGIRPATAKTPLWAVVRGVELSNGVSGGGPVRFVLDPQ